MSHKISYKNKWHHVLSHSFLCLHYVLALCVGGCVLEVVFRHVCMHEMVSCVNTDPMFTYYVVLVTFNRFDKFHSISLSLRHFTSNVLEVVFDQGSIVTSTITWYKIIIRMQIHEIINTGGIPISDNIIEQNRVWIFINLTILCTPLFIVLEVVLIQWTFVNLLQNIYDSFISGQVYFRSN